MIGLDANVLIRFLVDDEPQQSAQARQLLTSLTPDEPGHINLIALVETLWVLKHHYRIPRDRIIDTIEGLLNTPALKFQCGDEIRQAVQNSRTYNIDLPDALLMCLDINAGCTYTATFDRRATRLPGMKLIT